jgi:hypothetical protein
MRNVTYKIYRDGVVILNEGFPLEGSNFMREVDIGDMRLDIVCYDLNTKDPKFTCDAYIFTSDGCMNKEKLKIKGKVL